MRSLLVAVLVMANMTPGIAQRTRGLEALAATMVGSYTSAEQAKSDTSYFEIELEMARIWPKRKDGAWLSETPGYSLAATEIDVREHAGCLLVRL